MKNTIFFISFLLSSAVYAQEKISLDKKGSDLKLYYLSLNVEGLWTAGYHVNWETGIADKTDATSGNHTHCSAFAAAACAKLRIYLLRPPEHKQELLANAQYDWMSSEAATEAGWKPIAGNDLYKTVQSMANKGYVVVAVCKNPDARKPGHIALVMPTELTTDKLEDAGPMVIMAGNHNFNKISLKNGFKSHIAGQWPENIVLF